MPTRQEIEIVIKRDGTVEEKVTGVMGSSCEKVTEAIERALGDVAKREHTPDYYNQSQGTDETVTNHT